MAESRRQSRELALQVLFQRSFTPQIDYQQSLNNFRESFKTSEDVWRYAELLLSGLEENLERIDSSIQAASPNWRLERMALVDLNILRIASFEILYQPDDIPSKAAINEAIEIAKKYGNTESHKFVNGILDEVLKSSRT